MNYVYLFISIDTVWLKNMSSSGLKGYHDRVVNKSWYTPQGGGNHKLVKMKNESQKGIQE